MLLLRAKLYTVCVIPFSVPAVFVIPLGPYILNFQAGFQRALTLRPKDFVLGTLQALSQDGGQGWMTMPRPRD